MASDLHALAAALHYHGADYDTPDFLEWAILQVEKMQARIKSLEPYEPRVTAMEIQNGEIDVSIKSKELVEIMASIFETYLDQIGAENYGEIQGETHANQLTVDVGRPILVTIQRRDGKTPHTLRREAEAEVARLQAEIAELKNVMKDAADERNH
jgi:hypothetical protein